MPAEESGNASVPTPHPPIIRRLRDRTGTTHAALEAALGLDRITSSRDEYARVLATFHAIVGPLEEALTRSPVLEDPALRLSERLRAQRLTSDLRTLDQAASAPVPIPWHAPDSAQAAGILYVLEGSTLGARVISAALKERLGIGPENGGSYFAGRGPATAAMWGSFLSWIEKFTTPEKIDDATTAADSTFQIFLKEFRSQ